MAAINWAAIAMQEGDSISDLSSGEVQQVAGGVWWIAVAIGLAILLWPSTAEAPDRLPE